MIRVGDQWLADFASCNYLGFDLDRESSRRCPPPRCLGYPPMLVAPARQPLLYEEIEARADRTAGLRGLPRPAHDHPHPHVRDPAPRRRRARSSSTRARTRRSTTAARSPMPRGAAIRRFSFEDPDHLEALLNVERDPTRLVCMDGVNSMTGDPPDLPAFAEVAAATAPCCTSTTRTASASSASAARTSRRSTGCAAIIVRHFGLTTKHRPRRRLLEGLLLATGIHLLPDRVQGDAQGRGTAVPVLGASPIASLATVLAGLEVNELRGDVLRAELHRLSKACSTAWASWTSRRRPVQPADREIPVRDHPRGRLRRRFLFDNGVYVTLAVSARPQGGGRFPRAADGGEHRRRGQRIDGRHRRARRTWGAEALD